MTENSSQINSILETINNSTNDYYMYRKSENKIYPVILEIKGNRNTPYEGGVFFIEIISVENIKFITKICSIFVDMNSGEIKDKTFIKYDSSSYKNNLINIINFIKDEILISPNTTELIEKKIDDWPGKEIYYKYLSKIKSYTQKYANLDGKKIKIDNNLLSNNDFSKYENLKQFDNSKNKKRIVNEFRKELEMISKAKSSLNLNIENIYFCPFNNFKQIYFEFLGESDTPYEGGVFQILFEIHEKYPLMPGKCIFRTKIFHNKFDLETSEICDAEFHEMYNPFLSLYYICLYYYKILNIYDFICSQNKIAKELIYSNFSEYIKQVKSFTQKYANNEGIKYISNIKLLQNNELNYNIKAPIKPDFMPNVNKETDNSIIEEEYNIILENKINGVGPIKFKIKSTDFVIDVCLNLREYLINNKIYQIEEYQNLLPKIAKINTAMKYLDYGKQIGFYQIKNDDKLFIRVDTPTCCDSYVRIFGKQRVNL